MLKYNKQAVKLYPLSTRRLIYNGRNNMQTRGLIVLLISKAAGQLKPEELEQDQPAGVSLRLGHTHGQGFMELNFKIWFKK